MPELRGQAEDIPLLARHYLQQFAEEYSKPVKQLSEEAAHVLAGYAWPGNVRELRNVIERLVILEHAEVIGAEQLPADLRRPAKLASRSLIELPAEGVELVDVERELVRQAMERAAGNQSRAAELLGLERDAFRRRMMKHGYLTNTEVSAAKC